MNLETDISDIQFTKDENVEITLCDGASNDFAKITITKHSAWEIHDWCQRNIIYASELKKQKRR